MKFVQIFFFLLKKVDFVSDKASVEFVQVQGCIHWSVNHISSCLVSVLSSILVGVLLQGHCAVKNQSVSTRVRVHTKETIPLKLELVINLG